MKRGLKVLTGLIVLCFAGLPLFAQPNSKSVETFVIDNFDSVGEQNYMYNGVTYSWDWAVNSSRFVAEGYPRQGYYEGIPNSLKLLRRGNDTPAKVLGVQTAFNRKGDNWFEVYQANDTLSIQVHPDDDWAVKLEGEGNRGKTECWYVLDAKPDAKIVYGIKEGYSNQVLSDAITQNKLEDYLEFVNVQKGDFIFIPAGTVHAIGAGLRLMEVQQSCDLTYRLYDWGRGREVHIQKGLSVIKREGMIPVAKFPGKFECE